MNFTLGEYVTTDFYPKDKKLHRLVIDIEPGMRSQTGIFVTTLDEHCRKLRCDSAWYTKVKK